MYAKLPNNWGHCASPGPLRARATSPRLGLAELIAFLGDRDEAFRLLRSLRIPCCDPARPVRVPLDRVWAAVSRKAVEEATA